MHLVGEAVEGRQRHGQPRGPPPRYMGLAVQWGSHLVTRRHQRTATSHLKIWAAEVAAAAPHRSELAEDEGHQIRLLLRRPTETELALRQQLGNTQLCPD